MTTVILLSARTPRPAGLEHFEVHHLPDRLPGLGVSDLSAPPSQVMPADAGGNDGNDRE